MCPPGTNCTKCHYVKVDWDRFHGDRLVPGRAEKFYESEYPGPKIPTPYMHVCLDQQNLGKCELVLLCTREKPAQIDWPVVVDDQRSVMVMLIRWLGNRDIAERITIGEISEIQWEKLRKVEKVIFLG